MKILYITSDGFDTPSPNNQMAEVMINDFLDNGCEVHLIQSRRTRKFPEIPASLINKKGFSCDIVERKVFDRNKFVTRYINDVLYAFSAMKYWLKVRDADVIYLQSNPTVLFPMLLLKLFKGLPILYCIYDVWPGHAYDIGVVKSRLLYNIFRLLNKPCYKMADAISVMSEDMKATVISEGASAEKVHIVYPWYDEKTTKEIPLEKNRFIRKFNIPQDKFYVQFAGTIGYVFDCETVIEVAKRLSDEENIVFQIVGDGNVKAQFEKSIEEAGLKNIHLYPLQPVELVPDVYSTGNVCLIPLKKSVIFNGVPSKAPILMACKRVIINSVDINSDYARMFTENNIGIAADIGDYDTLADKIKQLYHSPEMREAMAQSAYAYAHTHFSSSANTRKFTDIFYKIAEEKK